MHFQFLSVLVYIHACPWIKFYSHPYLRTCRCGMSRKVNPRIIKTVYFFSIPSPFCQTISISRYLIEIHLQRTSHAILSECSLFASVGNFHWTPEDVAKSMTCMLMSGPLLTGYTQVCGICHLVFKKPVCFCHIHIA